MQVNWERGGRASAATNQSKTADVATRVHTCYPCAHEAAGGLTPGFPTPFL
jgi:hypothetical protein